MVPATRKKAQSRSYRYRMVDMRCTLNTVSSPPCSLLENFSPYVSACKESKATQFHLQLSATTTTTLLRRWGLARSQTFFRSRLRFPWHLPGDESPAMLGHGGSLEVHVHTASGQSSFFQLFLTTLLRAAWQFLYLRHRDRSWMHS